MAPDSLSGRVFELTPIDVLQGVTRLIAGEETPTGPILLTEPYRSSMDPFITMPITVDDCLIYRRKRRQFM